MGERRFGGGWWGGKRKRNVPVRPESAVEMSLTQESQLSGTEKVAW